MEYIKKANDISMEITEETENTVKQIIKDVKSSGDEAVQMYEKKFSQSSRPLRVTEEEMEESIAALPEETKVLIERIVDRVTKFAEAQMECLLPLDKDFGDGIRMGHRIIPVEKVGAYVPGGRFPLLSSGPMVTAPAKVAGAKRIIACSPANYNGSIHPAVLYGLKCSGATDVFAIGGAQAVAAMALGTETVPEVDVISGPGNRFVAEAKRQVFGRVGIDLIAGPSEILVFADETSNPKACAADLLAQAEHDPNSRAILVSLSKEQAEAVIEEVEQLLETFAETSPAHEAWSSGGEVLVVDSLEEGIKCCNDYAIEHLHVHIPQHETFKDQFKHYGSLFSGEESSVVFSDKVSGTNHTLPTHRGARYTGGLWVGNYVKVATHQTITGNGTQYLAEHATAQSEIEGLEGHRLSAEWRLKN
ncbi:histidinol dehydrogenase/sulfopropanediol 3-dehydrogenase [Sinobaca qinghaiensis]|uniref:Histidinol dehydrogenase/sulfopropanediol 3-dehydrogenase n=1 Tax=Sinobaca qinghaiensis TaxID=342944 RepID=A0A419V8Q1_9BACL|nr:histidinol dehydrogenase [Sinobaca qinghaiensis]RKD76348.1 histidinol dehydrogenase/sulfopropanediol 3-dehydrogenase [Sinobaca qinghaiensis]